MQPSTQATMQIQQVNSKQLFHQIIHHNQIIKNKIKQKSKLKQERAVWISGKLRVRKASQDSRWIWPGHKQNTGWEGRAGTPYHEEDAVCIVDFWAAHSSAHQLSSGVACLVRHCRGLRWGRTPSILVLQLDPWASFPVPTAFDFNYEKGRKESRWHQSSMLLFVGL